MRAQLMETTTQFVSVEVAIRTNHPCDEWIKWFERKDNFVNKIEGDQHAWFVYFDPIPSVNANTTIQILCKEIEELPEEIKIHWTIAEEREFFIGYHVGESPQCFVEHLDTKTIELIHQQRASVRIAMYPTPDSSRNRDA